MMWRIWRVMAAGGHMGRAMLLAVVVLLAGAGLLVLSGWFISATALAGLAGAGVMFDVFRPAASIRGLALLRTASRYGERWLGHDATLRGVAALRLMVLGGLARAPWRQLQRQRRGAALAQVVADTDTLDALPLRVVMPLVAGLVAIVAVGGLIGWLAGWVMALWIAGTHLGGAIAAGLWGARRGPRTAAQELAARAAFGRDTLDLIAARDDLAIHGRLPHQLAQAMQAEARIAEMAALQDRDERDAALILDLTRTAAMGGALALGAMGVESSAFGPAIAGACFFAALALGEATAPLRRMVTEYGRIRDAAQRVGPMLEIPAPRGTAQAGEVLPLTIGGLSIGAGQVLAVSGPSGAGKTTLLERIAGLGPDAEPPIRLGGIRPTDWDEGELRARLTMVPQRPALIAGTLRDNLALAAPVAEDAELLAALQAVRLDHLRGGLDLWLKDGGAGLSGGEQRRLALARAILRQPQLLILDEPTEGLDAATARAVLAGIRQALPQAAIVLASHRPSDLQGADFRMELS